MAKKDIVIVNYPYDKGETDFPEGLLKDNSELSKAIRKFPLDISIETFKLKQNIKATSNGFYVACYEEDLEVIEEDEG